MALKSITLRPGECVVLPSDAVIDSMITTGSISVSSSCGNDTLPIPSAYKCGYFEVRVASEEGEGQAMNEKDAWVAAVTVGGTTYVINELFITSEDNPGNLTTEELLNLHISDQVLFKFTEVNRSLFANNQVVRLFFQAPDSLFDDVTLKVADGSPPENGIISYYKGVEHDCDDYPEY